MENGALRDAGVAADFYDERFRHGYMDDWSQEKRDRVAALLGRLPLPAHGRALDFGCGVGSFTQVLHAVLPGWEIEGTDLSPVAVETAARRLPGCHFFQLADCGTRAARYDLIFSHHVLEHVSDLDETAGLLAHMSKPTASMFHILPCGNAGSFEHSVCLLHRDGIKKNPERLFFFEDEGHLRRLDTNSLVALWTKDRYRLERAWYANQRFSAWKSRTSFGLEQVFEFTDPDKAIDVRARRKLQRLRAGLTALWALRKPIAIVQSKKMHGCRSIRDWVVFAVGVGVYPVAAIVEQVTRYLADREWRLRSDDPRGSEMYVYLVRPSSCDPSVVRP